MKFLVLPNLKNSGKTQAVLCRYSDPNCPDRVSCSTFKRPCYYAKPYSEKE